MFGSHVKLQDTIAETMLEASLQGMKSIQIFLGSPYSLARRSVDKDDIKECCILKDMNVFTHLPYVHNFAGIAKLNRVAYTGDPEVDLYVQRCAQSVMKELNVLDQISCSCKGCVLHVGSIGKNVSVDVGLQAISKTINSIDFSSSTTPLLLETMVQTGGVLGTSFEQLATIYEHIRNKQNIGFCIDTCHVHANGQYNLSDETQVTKMFEDYDRFFPRDSLKLIHLNDSVEGFGSRKDRHANLKTGSIWKEKDQSLKYLLQIAKQRDIPVVLETTEDDFKTLLPYMK